MWQIIINGPGYFDTAYDLPEGVTTLGRADENDIVLSGDLVSRRHARLVVSGERLVIEDLGSRNGSRVNAEPLQGKLELKQGDTLSVGENTLAVRRPAPAENALTDVVDATQSGVRRYGKGVDIAQAVIFSKDVRQSALLRALDNVAPFDLRDSPFADLDPNDKKTPVIRLQPSGDKPPGAFEAVALLYKASELLTSAPTLQAFLDATLARLMEQVNATTAVVLLRHPTGVMVPAAVRHRGKLEQGEVPVSDAVVEAALHQGAAMAVGDVRDDSRFADRESVILYGIDQVLCVPIGAKEPFDGVLYLNRAGRNPAEVERLLDLCTAVAHLIGSALEKFQGLDRGGGPERIRRLLERFHGPEVVERRLGELTHGGKLSQLEERGVTVLSADLTPLTALVGRLSPERVGELLSDFIQKMAGIAFSFEGTVDRLSPEGLLVLFGTPYGRGDDALRAVRAALSMKAEWGRTLAKRTPKERCDLRVGISTGRAMVGTVGSEARLEHAALGEPVDVANALRASAAGGQVLITGKTLAAIGARFDVTPLGERPVAGVREKVSAFEVLEEDLATNTSPGVD